MKKIFLLFFAIIFGQLFAQKNDLVHDPKALEILDKLSEKLSKDSTIRINFQYFIYNAQDSTQDSLKGYLFVKGEKYKLILPKVEVFCDGKKVYSYNMEANEMNITLYDPNNTDVLTPTNLLQIYKKGFKYRLRATLSFKAKRKKNHKIVYEDVNSYVIDLYPEQPKGVPYSIIRIWIDKDKNELLSIMYQGKNGIQQVVNILEFKENIYIPDQLFKFDKTKYPPDMEINDFTEENQ